MFNAKENRCDEECDSIQHKSYYVVVVFNGENYEIMNKNVTLKKNRICSNDFPLT